MNKTLDIISYNIPFTVRLVLNGDQYGLNKVLTHLKNDPLVEFYDKRYPHTPDGQFVSNYYLSTLLKRNDDVGLCLDGGIPDWNIAKREMNLVMNWLQQNPLTKDFCEENTTKANTNKPKLS